MSEAQFHDEMARTQYDGFSFYVTKYRNLAELSRKMGALRLADVLEKAARDAEEVRDMTQALFASGVN